MLVRSRRESLVAPRPMAPTAWSSALIISFVLCYVALPVSAVHTKIVILGDTAGSAAASSSSGGSAHHDAAAPVPSGTSELIVSFSSGDPTPAAADGGGSSTSAVPQAGGAVADASTPADVTAGASWDTAAAASASPQQQAKPAAVVAAVAAADTALHTADTDSAPLASSSSSSPSPSPSLASSTPSFASVLNGAHAQQQDQQQPQVQSSVTFDSARFRTSGSSAESPTPIHQQHTATADRRSSSGSGSHHTRAHSNRNQQRRDDEVTLEEEVDHTLLDTQEPNEPSLHYTDDAHGDATHASFRSLRAAAGDAAGTGSLPPVYKRITQRSEPACDLVAERGISLYNGQKILLPDARPKGLIAYWSFDDARCLDGSVNQNHCATMVPAGVGRGGIGASAALSEGWMEVVSSPSLESLQSSTFTVSMFIQLNPQPEDGDDVPCTLISMGDKGSEVFFLKLNEKTRRIIYGASKGTVRGASRSRLRDSMWHHLALVRTTTQLKLYVNGVFDSAQQYLAVPGYPNSQLYVGRAPTDDLRCDISMFVDDLRLYNRSLQVYEITAQSFPSLGSMEPEYARLGCGQPCLFDDAVKNCAKGQYHICHQSELNSGALAVAYKNGWITYQDSVWAKETADSNDKRIALCCSDVN